MFQIPKRFDPDPEIEISTNEDVILEDSNPQIKKIEKKNIPPKNNSFINRKFEFGGTIELNPKFIMDRRTQLTTVNNIIRKHFYFNPVYYNFDLQRRTLYTKDNQIQLKLNFNFIGIDQRYLYFIMSVMQLNLLEYIGNSKRDEVISIVAKYLELKMEYKYRRKWGIFQKFINGKEVKRIVMTLTSKEFNNSMSLALLDLQISHNARGFQYNKGESRKLFNDSS